MIFDFQYWPLCVLPCVCLRVGCAASELDVVSFILRSHMVSIFFSIDKHQYIDNASVHFKLNLINMFSYILHERLFFSREKEREGERESS